MDLDLVTLVRGLTAKRGKVTRGRLQLKYEFSWVATMLLWKLQLVETRFSLLV